MIRLEHWLLDRIWMKVPLRTWSPLFVYRYLADFRTEGADVVLERDVLEEGVLQHGLQLLVDLEAQLQGHARVSHLAVVQTRHNSLTSPNFCLEIQKIIETFRVWDPCFGGRYLQWWTILNIYNRYLTVIGLYKLQKIVSFFGT